MFTNTSRRLGFKMALALCLAGTLAASGQALADTAFSFSTGTPDGKIATLSQPGSAGKVETETADDFILSGITTITGGSFTGLLPSGTPLSDVSSVTVEIYRVFPKDSDTSRTINVPTRANSPSDVEFADRSTTAGTLSVTPSILNTTFTANNSVVNGINKSPNQFTGGEGSVTGEEVVFDLDFTTPFVLPADHYFFVPQVELSSGEFLWLSAPRPITGGTGPFAPDLQSWIRNADLDPDWLRVGTDITGQGPFNAAFSLDGATVPEPGTLLMMGVGLAGAALLGRRMKKA